MATRYDLIVIGGGLSGLSLARLCMKAGWQVAVLESASRPGGCIHSSRTLINGTPFWLELGAHTLFNSYTHLLQLAPEEVLHARLLQRQRLPYLLWRQDRFRSIAKELRWGELVRHLPRAITTPRSGQSIGGYFSKIVGPNNFARVIGPALDGLLCQPSRQFPAELIFKKRQRTHRFPQTFSLQNGLTTLVEQLVEGITLFNDTAVNAIRRSHDGYECETEIRTFMATRLALATPVDEAARLLQYAESEIARQLRAIGTAELDSTAVVAPADSISLAPLAGAVAREAPFYSIVTRDVIAKDRLRGFTFHFRPGFTDAQRLAIAADVLHTHTTAFLHTAHAHHRLPALRVSHAERLQEIERLLAEKRIALTGNYFGGLSLEDCVARSEREAKRLMALG